MSEEKKVTEDSRQFTMNTRTDFDNIDEVKYIILDSEPNRKKKRGWKTTPKRRTRV